MGTQSPAEASSISSNKQTNQPLLLVVQLQVMCSVFLSVSNQKKRDIQCVTVKRRNKYIGEIDLNLWRLLFHRISVMPVGSICSSSLFADTTPYIWKQLALRKGPDISSQRKQTDGMRQSCDSKSASPSSSISYCRINFDTNFQYQFTLMCVTA